MALILTFVVDKMRTDEAYNSQNAKPALRLKYAHIWLFRDRRTQITRNRESRSKSYFSFIPSKDENVSKRPFFLFHFILHVDFPKWKPNIIEFGDL